MRNDATPETLPRKQTKKRFTSIDEFKRAVFPDAFAREHSPDDNGAAIGEQLAEESRHVVQAAFAAA